MTVARIVETQTTCDMDGAQGASPYALTAYVEIDLCENCKEGLFELLQPYIAKSRPVRRTTKRAKMRKTPTVDSRTVRTWARGAGIDVPDRGRVPMRVVEQFQAAHA